MLPRQYSSNPYDTTRPKSFFNDRKRMMKNEISLGDGGKSYNASWNTHKKSASTFKVKDAGHSRLTSMSNLTLYISVLIASLVWVS